MQVSAKTLNYIEDLILNHPYRSGKDIVNLFNSFGERDIGVGEESRTNFIRKKLNLFNGTDRMKALINEIIDPIQFDKDESVKLANSLNTLLRRDGYNLVPETIQNRSLPREQISDLWGEIMYGNCSEATAKGLEEYITETIYAVEPISDEKLASVEQLRKVNHEFINEQIKKAERKINENDYDGAITNVRSLCEAVQKEIIMRMGLDIPEHDGDLLKLYKSTKQVLNLDPSQKDLSDTLKQILSGLNSLVSGIAGISNKMADRHSRQYKPHKHHAKLAINSAYTFCEFLFDTFEYQNSKDKKNEE